jgi:multicomponent K+:H+ antiporter subunit E
MVTRRSRVLAFGLLVSWLLLSGDFSPGNILLGIVLAVGIERYARTFNDEPERNVRINGILHLVAVVIKDVIIANIQVAQRVLGPLSALRPGFVVVPLDLTDRTAIATLGAIVTTTPGTVTAALTPDRRFLLGHALDVDDSDLLVRTIKQRYERPLKEIFQC